MWLVKPVVLKRGRCPDHPGWDQITFRCLAHNRPYSWRGEPAAVDEMEAHARINPCKIIDCPERVKPLEER